MDTIYVVDGRSLSCKSFSTDETTKALLEETPLYSDSSLTVGPYTLDTNGQIDRDGLDTLLNGFSIVRKNKKFFDLASTAIFHCTEPLTALLQNLLPEDVGLYVNLGPANARLDEFSFWADENDRDSHSPFTSMMASSVVKILPNVVMSNLSMNLPIKGENTISAGTSVTSVQVLSAAIKTLQGNKTRAAIVSSASFPCDYFNIDAYTRYFDNSFFRLPLVEAASAVLLTSDKGLMENNADNDSSIPTICGEITTVHSGKYPNESTFEDVLSGLGMNQEAYDVILSQPNQSGNLLSASEPTGIIAVLKCLGLKLSTENARETVKGLSITRDWFGNFSVVELVRRRKNTCPID